MTPTFIDLYCERVGTDFWSEPANAITNIVFLFAAALAWGTIKKRANSDIWEKGIVCLVAMIGVGSFLLHTFATTWAAQADIIPIWTFVVCYVVLITYRLNNHDAGKTIKTIAIAVAAVWIIKLIVSKLFNSNTSNSIIGMFGGDAIAFEHAHASSLNGSEQYLPALIALLIFAAICAFLRHPARNYIAGASVLFLAALFFRSVDMVSCEATFGLGTHFLWHVTNGFVVGLLLEALVKTMPPKPETGGM